MLLHEEDDCENHVYLYFFHPFFGTLLLSSTLMTDSIEIDNAGPPMAIPIYTVLCDYIVLYCVIISYVISTHMQPHCNWKYTT